jgi:hypothetical protein
MRFVPLVVGFILLFLFGCKKPTSEDVNRLIERDSNSVREDTLGDSPITETHYPPKPPNFPQLPEDYTEWQEASRLIKSEAIQYYRPENMPPKMNEASLNIYVLTTRSLKHREGYANNNYGWIYHKIDSTKKILPDGDQAILVEWRPHSEGKSDSAFIYSNLVSVFREEFFYLNLFSIITTGYEEVNIDEKRAWRLRGRWWESYQDDIYQQVGSFTTYYIPTEKLDFRITCLTLFYERDPHYLPEGVSYDDPVPEDWTYEKTYPNRIRQLEHAVEQTFRVKE